MCTFVDFARHASKIKDKMNVSFGIGSCTNPEINILQLKINVENNTNGFVRAK